MIVMLDFTMTLHHLEQERTRLASQLANLSNAISALSGTPSNRTGRRISAAGRARIAAAQRARGAKVKGTKVVPIATNKRTISSAARRRIAAAQRTRWAKWRKEKKSA